MQYLKDANFTDLRDRIKLITCNYRFFDHKKSQTRFAGHYHAYYPINIPSTSLAELDDFLRKSILSNNGRIGRSLSQSLTIKQRRELLRLSFRRGFERKIQFAFSPSRLKRLIECWKLPRRAKRNRARIRLNHSDVWRTLLTDTAPFEVPIIFSNDGFNKNLLEYESRSLALKKLINALVLSSRKFTIPWRYNIVRDTEGVRTLSLLHPSGQVELARFYNHYDQLICEYGQKSPFSIRKPTKIGASFFSQSTFSEKNKYKNTSVDVSQIDRLLRNPASYFSYERYDRLYRFFMSNEHITLEKQFKYQLSLDVSKCFDSIYTHSISWAVKDKKIAKDHKQAHSFGNQFDGTMQRLNHNETSGICIGPEASRIFAEIILARVDELALNRLIKFAKLKHKTDFECCRYIDNYYVFANSKAVLSRVEQEIADALRSISSTLMKARLNDTRDLSIPLSLWS